MHRRVQRRGAAASAPYDHIVHPVPRLVDGDDTLRTQNDACVSACHTVACTRIVKQFVNEVCD